MHRYIYFQAKKGNVKSDKGTKKISKLNVGKDMSTDETDSDFDKSW